VAAKHQIEELVDELEGDLLRAGGRLRTLQGTARLMPVKRLVQFALVASAFHRGDAGADVKRRLWHHWMRLQKLLLVVFA
jgi:hypothetical protein